MVISPRFGVVEHLLEAVAGRLGGGLLGVVDGVDRRPVLGADVVALAHAQGRVVVLPEQLEHRLEADDLGVEHHQRHLGVAGPAGADLLVGGVRREAAGVAHRGGDDAGGLPEELARSPRSSPCRRRAVSLPSGKGGTIETPLTKWGRGSHSGLVTAGEGLVGVDHLVLLGSEEHAQHNAARARNVPAQASSGGTVVVVVAVGPAAQLEGLLDQVPGLADQPGVLLQVAVGQGLVGLAEQLVGLGQELGDVLAGLAVGRLLPRLLAGFLAGSSSGPPPGCSRVSGASPKMLGQGLLEGVLITISSP